jgi:DNA-binding PucR family transcriptional regulator
MSFRYIDRISQLVLIAYQDERDRWLANQNRVRALRVQETIDAGEIDIDETATAIGYPLRCIHLSAVVWCGESESGDELLMLERFTSELGKSLDTRKPPLFIAADRVTGWAWILCRLTPRRMWWRALAGSPRVEPTHRGLPSVIRCRASRASAAPINKPWRRAPWRLPRGRANHGWTAASDPGLGVAARFSGDLKAARAWVGEVLGPLASATDVDERLRETLRAFLAQGRASRPPPTSCICIPTR